MRIHARILAVALAVVASGCSLIVDPEAKDPMATAEGFCNSIQDVWARMGTRCEGVDPDWANTYIGQFRTGCENLGNAEGAGRFGYDQAIADQCIAMFQGVDCGDDIANVFEFCALAVPGQVPPGGDCYSPGGLLEECSGGGTCDSSMTCPGFCVVPGNLNQPCATAGSSCAAGLWCNPSLVCVSMSNYNSLCTYPSPPCRSGLFCDANVLPSPACRYVPGSVGATCSTSVGCTNDLVCIYNSAYATYQCANPAPNGADCSWAASSYQCVSGNYCRYDHVVYGYTCRTIPTSPQGVGGDCAHGGVDDCQAGLYCSYPYDTCQPIIVTGGACTASSQCGSTSTCAMLDNESTGTCVVPKAKGAPCRAGAGECRQGLWCDGASADSTGICRAYGTTGSRCGYPYYGGGSYYNEWVECAVGYWCYEPAYGSGTCAPVAPVGGSCMTGGYEQCGTEAWCDTTDPVNPVCVPFDACQQPVGWFPFFER